MFIVFNGNIWDNINILLIFVDFIKDIQTLFNVVEFIIYKFIYFCKNKGIIMVYFEKIFK